MRAKLAVIGGGSPFVLVALHGLVERADRWRQWDGEILVDLYDIAPERTERWVRYGGAIAGVTGLRLEVRGCDERQAAVRDADVVLFSVGLPQAQAAAEQARERFGFDAHSIHDGPPAFVSAAHLFPLCRAVADEVNECAAEALLLILPNPTDTLAEAVHRATGARAAGFCVEVEQLRDHLAYYLDISPDSIDLRYAGVNHSGWTLRWEVDGEDGHARYGEEILRLPEHPDFHPGNHGMVELYRATGYLRSSPYHNWPLRVRPYDGPRTWDEFGVSREERLRLVDEAISARRLLTWPRAIHPERCPVKFFGTGRAIADLLWARATGEPMVVPMQIRNAGAVQNLAGDLRLELPTRVTRHMCTPTKVGPMPDGLAGPVRMLAEQRLLLAQYLVSGGRELLRDALLAFPLAAPVDVLHQYAEFVHRTWQKAESRPHGRGQ